MYSSETLGSYMIAEEGANIDALRLFMDHGRKIRPAIKAAKAALQRGDKALAKSQLNDAEENLAAFSDGLDNLSPSIGSNVLAKLAQILFVDIYIALMRSAGSAVGSIAGRRS